MKEHDLDPLSADLLDLLKGDREPPPISPEMRSRLFERVTVSIPVGGGGGGGGGAVTPKMKGAALRAISTRTWAIVLSSAMVGGILGALAHARFGEARVVIVEKAVSALGNTPQNASATPLPAASIVEAPPATASPPNIAPAPMTAPPSTDRAFARDDRLAAERGALEMVRTALARGNTDSALGAIARHERDFPRGRLREEREALAVQVLVRAGRTEDARARAVRFRSDFPRSMLVPVVDAALTTIP